MNITANLAELLKLPAKILIALAIATGLILFLPDNIANKLYMINFRNTYGFIIGIVFTISVSISVVYGIIILFKYCYGKYCKYKFMKNAIERLERLSSYQKFIIYDLYLEDNYTEELPLHDGAVRILEHNLMIGKATNQYFIDDLNNAVFPYMLQPWVVKNLNENQTLVEKFKCEYEKYENRFMSNSQKQQNIWNM